MSFADNLRKNQNNNDSEKIKKIIQENKLYDLDNALINKYVEKMIQKIKSDCTAYASKGELYGYLGISPRDKNRFSAVISNYLYGTNSPPYCFSNNTAKIIKDKLIRKLKDLGFKRVKVRVSPQNREVRNAVWFIKTIPCYCIHFSIRW